jgi:PilZ domain
MGQEFRKSKRRYVRHGARIIRPDGIVLGTCVMADLSATGARLQVKQPATLPDEFILLLSHTGQLHRKCSVTWRAETEVGVKFVVDRPPK